MSYWTRTRKQKKPRYILKNTWDPWVLTDGWILKTKALYEYVTIGRWAKFAYNLTSGISYILITWLCSFNIILKVCNSISLIQIYISLGILHIIIASITKTPRWHYSFVLQSCLKTNVLFSVMLYVMKMLQNLSLPFFLFPPLSFIFYKCLLQKLQD